MGSTIEVVDDARVRIITFNRPDALNAFNDAMYHEAGSALEEVQRRHILEVLERTRGVIEGEAGAAKILRLHPNTLRSRMKKLGIRRATHEIS